MAVLTGPSEPKEGSVPQALPPSDPVFGPSSAYQPAEALQRHHSDGMNAHLLHQQHSDGADAHSDGADAHSVIQRQASEGNHAHLISTDHDGLMHDEVGCCLCLRHKRSHHILPCILLLPSSQVAVTRLAHTHHQRYLALLGRNTEVQPS